MIPQIAGHETFYPRAGWIPKGLAAVEEHPTIFSRGFPYATDQLGVGVNMVKSIRHWLTVLGLIERFEQDAFVLTDFAQQLRALDPEFEHPATLQILQYHLVSSPTRATTWHWFFCRSGLISFTKDQFLQRLTEYIASLSNRQQSQKSLERDFLVLTRMYTSDSGEKNGTDLFYPCPFIGLNLLSFSPEMNRYHRNLNNVSSMAAFLYSLFEFQKRVFPDSQVLDLERTANFADSPFQALGLTVLDFLDRFEKLPSKLRTNLSLSTTAGMRTIQMKPSVQKNALKAAYSETNELSLVS